MYSILGNFYILKMVWFRQEVKNASFLNVEVLQEDTLFEGIKLTKTKGEHGRGEILKFAGKVCGLVFHHPNEETLYVAGDNGMV